MKNRKREIRTSGSVRDEDGQHPHLLGRRQFLHLAAGAAAFPTILRTAYADAYPSRPVRYIVGYAPGGGSDIVARLMGQWLSERTGQQFVIENRPGAGTNIAAEAVVNAPPDGYTLLSAGAPNAINATLYEKLNFNFIRDIVPVAGIVSVASVLAVHPSVSAKTVPEFIAYAKANPGKIDMATNGNGSTSHISAELFKMMTGVNMVNIPYRGTAPAIAALLGGQVQGSFVALPGSIAYIKAGRLRAIAVTTAMRSEALPDIPTVAEFVPGYEASVWYGIGAPAKTSSEIVDKLNKEVNAALADPKMKALFENLGGTAIAGSPTDFGTLITDETEKWGKVIRAANIKAE
jgi:tripartite-type tricarboxylate transporter receptor subunit TctC